MSKIKIHFRVDGKNRNISHYVLPNNEKHEFVENENSIDLQPLKKYIGQDFDAFKNGVFWKTLKLTNVDKIRTKDNEELLAIYYE